MWCPHRCLTVTSVRDLSVCYVGQILLHAVIAKGGDTRSCDGIDIVQSDHAPEAGVAQGIFHGDVIRHQVGHQEELEEELDEVVERRVRRNHSSNQTQVRMHG